MEMRHRVVVTGMGVVSPNGNGLSRFEQAIRHGVSGIRFLPELEERNFSCQIGGIPDDLTVVCEQYFTKKHILSMTTNISYAAVSAVDAWKDAGMAAADDQPDWDSGVIIGSGISDTETIALTVVPAVHAGKIKRIGVRTVEKVMSSAASARVAGLLGMGNQVTSNSSACSTGTEAIVDAARKIRMGFAKRMLAGGSEAPSPYTWSGFDAMRILPRNFNKAPEKGSRPMSATASGFVPGSGAGVLVLESLESALDRGVRIYAEILGGFINCGGQRGGGTMTAPNPEGVRRCILGALADSSIHPDEIDLISGHLTATFADPMEIDNWHSALGRSPASFPFINATKSMIGHCLGAAGAIESIAAVLQLYHGFLHPSINCEDLHPRIEPFAEKIVREYMDYPELNIIAKASFGFGDVNSCLILRKWRSEDGTPKKNPNGRRSCCF